EGLQHAGQPHRRVRAAHEAAAGLTTLRRIGWAATAFAAGFFIAAVRPRTARRGGQPGAGTSRTTRAAALARLGTRVGTATALNRAQRVGASPERRAALDEALQLRTAEEVAAALGTMKGAMMKLGQMASYIDEGVPEPVREALASLLQDAPPMSAELAASVVEAELGAPPGAVFQSWEDAPFAAASIGQVHRAVTHEGQDVAVKVQYPGVDAAIRSDLSNTGLLFNAVRMMFPGLEPGPLVAELKARLVEELD